MDRRTEMQGMYSFLSKASRVLTLDEINTINVGIDNKSIIDIYNSIYRMRVQNCNCKGTTNVLMEKLRVQAEYDKIWWDNNL